MGRRGEGGKGRWLLVGRAWEQSDTQSTKGMFFEYHTGNERLEDVVEATNKEERKEEEKNINFTPLTFAFSFAHPHRSPSCAYHLQE